MLYEVITAAVLGGAAGIPGDEGHRAVEGAVVGQGIAADDGVAAAVLGEAVAFAGGQRLGVGDQDVEASYNFV